MYIWVEVAVTQVDEMLSHCVIFFNFFFSGTKAWFFGIHKDYITLHYCDGSTL